jgi:hypothetical protein
VFSFSTDRLPLEEDLDSEWPLDLVTLLIAYGSMRCARGKNLQATHQFKIKI